MWTLAAYFEEDPKNPSPMALPHPKEVRHLPRVGKFEQADLTLEQVELLRARVLIHGVAPHAGPDKIIQVTATKENVYGTDRSA